MNKVQFSEPVVNDPPTSGTSGEEVNTPSTTSDEDEKSRPVSQPSAGSATDADYQAFVQWKQAQGAAKAADVPAESYVWLANGDVIRVKSEDLPGTAGSNAAYGHYEQDGNVYQIVGVYPVEEKGSN